MKRGTLLFAFLIILISANLVSATDIFFDGDLNFEINDSYQSGQKINTNIRVTNNEDFPISNAYLVIEVLKGCEEPAYPSQSSDCDNVFNETIISDINLPLQSGVKVPFSYQLPLNLKEGAYRIDAYLRTEKTPIVGIPHIFLPGKYRYFTVNSTGEFPYAKILRTKTNINNVTGPVGAGVSPGGMFDLKVYVDSSKDTKANLLIELCEWKDTKCDPLTRKEKTIDLSNKKFSIEMKAPEDPGAYSLRMELRGNELLSLYRSRIIVFGKTAEIRKMYPDKYYYSNEESIISFLIGGSPDHYNKPTVSNLELKTALKDEDEKLEKNIDIGKITPAKGFVKKKVTFDVNQMSNFQICGELTSGEERYDKYCYRVDSSNFSVDKHKIELKESYQNTTFKGEICVKNKVTGASEKANLFILARSGEKVVRQIRGEIRGCRELSFDMESKNGSILIQDKTTQQEFNFDITLPEKVKEGKGISYTLIGFTIAVVIVLIILIVLIIRKKNG